MRSYIATVGVGNIAEYSSRKFGEMSIVPPYITERQGGTTTTTCFVCDFRAFRAFVGVCAQ